MKEKINYGVDIDSSRLLYKLKQVVDEYQDIDRKIISTENFIKNYVPVDYREKDNEVYCYRFNYRGTAKDSRQV